MRPEPELVLYVPGIISFTHFLPCRLRAVRYATLSRPFGTSHWSSEKLSAIGRDRIMTLILEQASHRFVVQVSDRLLTRDGNAWDPRANKTLVFLAEDAVVAMSYTGDGDIGLMPTDQFIAESLSGHRWGSTRVPVLNGGMPAPWLPLRATLERLCDRLNAEFRFVYTRRADNQLCEILIAGWRRLPDGAAEPIVANVQKNPGKREFEIWQEAVPAGDHYIFAATPPGNAADDEISHLRARLRNALTPEDAEAAMVEAIRGVNVHCSYVGPNCMCVLIPPPSERRIRVRCLSVDRHLLAVGPRGGGPPKVVIPATFTPWIIGPGATSGPTVLSGRGYTVQLGDFTVEIDGPDTGSLDTDGPDTDRPGTDGPRILGAMGGIDRPRP